jgi:type IV pilus biogenesis protein CpaD/CtpE
MAIPSIIGRWFSWALLAAALVLVLSGCAQRDETNPFIGPNGASTSQPFG